MKRGQRPSGTRETRLAEAQTQSKERSRPTGHLPAGQARGGAPPTTRAAPEGLFPKGARAAGGGAAAANKRSARTPSAKRLRDSAFADALHSPRTAPLNLGGAPRRQGGQARPQGRTACSRRRLHAAATRASASERRRADNIIGRRLVRSAYLPSAQREL